MVNKTWNFRPGLTVGVPGDANSTTSINNTSLSIGNATFGNFANSTNVHIGNSTFFLDVSKAGIYANSPGTQGWITPVDKQTFLTSGTWIPPAHGTWLLITCWGAGGSGGVRSGAFGGGGGGGGAFSCALVPFDEVVANGVSTWGVTVGAGGPARNTQGPGTNGGDSYFGNLSSYVWTFAGGGCGGGNTGTFCCNGGHGGSPIYSPGTAGLSVNPNEDEPRKFFWNIDLYNAFGGANNLCTATTGSGSIGTANCVDAPWSLFGYGGGGGSIANTTFFGIAGGGIGGGGGGGGASHPTSDMNVNGTGGFADGNGGMPNFIAPTNWVGGAGGNGANNTSAAQNGAFPGGGGGGGGNTSPNLKPSGKGGDGCVVIVTL